MTSLIAMIKHYVPYVLHFELELIANVQDSFKSMDSWLVGLSEFLSPASLCDYAIPILGLTSIWLMGRTACIVALLNVISSVMKWIFPQYRPYSWIREHNIDTVTIRQSPLTCDTTSGFPSSHAMAFTGFVYVLLLHAKLPTIGRYLAILFVSIPMWIARIYFGSHFLHQCICGSLVAIHVIDTLRRRQKPSSEQASVVTWRKTIAIAAVCAVGVLVIAIYFAMLHLRLDPHWSVRMAFKWCKDPTYLRHETSPIFVMCRDLGFLLGVALSLPLTDRLQQRYDPVRRVPLLVVVIAVNYYTRTMTPKLHGRLVFVGYELVRNVIHSFVLLTIVPKLCVKKIK